MIISQVSDIVCTILIMTLAGSALILLLFALKPLIRHRLQKSEQYFLWLVALAALIVPVSKLIAIPDAPSQIILAPIHTALEMNNFIADEDANTLSQTNTTTAPQAESTDIPAVKPAFSNRLAVTTVFMMIYMFIVLVMLAYNIVSYIRFTKKVRRHRTRAHMEELYEHVRLCGDAMAPRLYRSSLATTPMLIGIFKPEIILPDREYTDTQIQSVLMHELTHLRRRDIIVKWLSVFACALHWFNPLVWLARREIDRICELSCDEAVIRKLDHAGKRNYGETLISIAADTNASRAVLSTTMCEEKEVLKERLNVIMKYQKRTWMTLLISTVIIVVSVCAVFVFGAGAARAAASGDKKADTLQGVLLSATPVPTPASASMESALPSAMPAPTPEPDYLYQLRQNAAEVNTEEEFADAMTTSSNIVIKKDITLSDEYYSFKNLNTLFIDEGVTLTITSLNFKVECRIVNLGEIIVADFGRMIYYGEPNRSNIGQISTRGMDSKICYFTGHISAKKIAHILRDDSMFNWICIVATSSNGEPVEITIDHDIVIPEGKAMWINSDSVLHVPQGVTLTNNGAIHYFNEPIIEGEIIGTGEVVCDG